MPLQDRRMRENTTRHWLTGLFIVILMGNTCFFSVYASTDEKRILLLIPKGVDFTPTIKGLKENLAEDINFIELVIDANTSSNIITRYIDDIKPKCWSF